MAGRRSKKQERAEALHPSRLGSTTSALMAEMVDMVQRTTGDLTATTLKDAGKFIIGIPAPSFAFEYLTCNTVLPLEKLIQLYGPRGIGKSGLAFEIARWFRKKRGLATLLEHESKFNPDWACSIYGNTDTDWMNIVPCDSIDEWERWLQKTGDFVRSKMTGTAKEPGTGRVFPYLQIVDSIMGKPSEETSKKIESVGSAGRGFSIEALSLAKFVKHYASTMRRWPFALICVNHQRIIESSEDGQKKIRTGGQTIDFQGSFEFEVSRIGRIRTAKFDGNILKILCEKNSYGEDKRHITVPVVWWDEPYQNPETGEQVWRQRTVFDWDASTVSLIADQCAKSGGAKWTEAKKLTGLVFDSKTRAHSKLLGVSNDNPLPFGQIGKLIRENTEMMEGLRALFNVRERKVFRNDMDYQQQLLALKSELAGMEDDGMDEIGVESDLADSEKPAESVEEPEGEQ